MRQFIRHPVCIPIEVSVTGQHDVDGPQTFNLGASGLAFRSSQKIEPGTLVRVKIPHLQPEFETEAKVTWCRERGQEVELGVEFLNLDDAYRARMMEQLCYIEYYKHEVNRMEGRTLSPQEAAAEWVSKYAHKFPDTKTG